MVGEAHPYLTETPTQSSSCFLFLNANDLKIPIYYFRTRKRQTQITQPKTQNQKPNSLVLRYPSL